MLSSNKMIGFVITQDPNKARGFYEETLGFKFVSEDQYALVMETDENMIRIATVKNFAPAQHTVLGWEVKQIERVASYMKERGVVFEHYPWMPPHELGIWEAPGGDKVAWFKDPDGNVLSLSQHVGR